MWNVDCRAADVSTISMPEIYSIAIGIGHYAERGSMSRGATLRYAYSRFCL